MPTHKEISDALIGLYKRRPGSFGKWIPVAFWIEKMQLEGINHGKLQRALEFCGTHMTNIEDSTHGHLHIEIILKRLPPPLGIKPFICCSTPKAPNKYVGNFDKSLFGKVLQASWERWINKTDDEDELVTEQNPPAQPTPRPSPPQPATMTATTTPTARVVTPSASSPQFNNEDDSDLLEFFRSIINPEYLTRNDLFSVTGLGLRAKLAAFGKRLEGAKHVDRLRFYSDAVPKEYVVDDITKLDPDPCLCGKYNIPMSVPAMSEVAQALYKLSIRVPEVLQFQKYSGSKGHGKRLIAIVPSTDKKRLYHNAKVWMDSIIDNAATDESTSYDVVKALIRVLHTADPLAFNHVAANVPQLNHSLVKLEPKFQQAMMFKSGVNKSQLRTIKSYLCAANVDVLQPESVIRSLEANDFVRPIAVDFKEGSRRKVAWYIPVDNLLECNTNKALEANSFDYNDLHKAHVILVGDHGQGAFRMMVTLLLITKPGRRRANTNEYIGSKLALEVDGQCGYVSCTKDTYNILKDTIASPVDHGLRNIRQAGHVTIYRDRLDANKVKMSFGNTHTQNTVLATAAVELFMVGDLAFYSMALGKESMANYWCWRCPLAKAEWTANTNIRVGPAWTQEGLRTHLERLRSGELDRKEAHDVRGVKDDVLFCIEPRNTIVPSLHNNELFVNTPMKSFMKWIHNRIEQIPTELVDARVEYIDLLIQLEVEQEQLADATFPLPLLQAEQASLQPRKTNGVYQYLYPEHEAEWNQARELLHYAKGWAADCKKQTIQTGKELKVLEKKISDIEKQKEYGALSQPIRQRIEELLQELCNIVRSAYHGGDFEGNHCRKLIRQADQVMDSIQQLLLDIPPEDRSDGCDDAEIQRYCAAYKRLFKYFDALVHYCHQPFGTLTDANMTELRRLVGMLDRLWRRIMETVPPKAHAWWHLLEDLERLRGLKHHSESKIEKAHQDGRRIDLLFRGVNDVEKKIIASLRYQHTMVKPDMKMLQAKVKEKRSRKRKASIVDADNEDDVNVVDRHRDILLLLEMPEVNDPFPSLKELAVSGRKSALANNNNNNNIADAE